MMKATEVCLIALSLLFVGCVPNIDISHEPKLPKGKKWKRIWYDDFDGSKLDESKWSRAGPYEVFGGWIVPDVVYLDGKGHLVIKVCEKGGQYYGGMVHSRDKFEHKYGLWIARCKMPREVGHFPSFWIWSPKLAISEEERAKCGTECGTEIDVFEWYATTPNKASITIHWRVEGKPQARNHMVDISGLAEGFHTFAVEWTPWEYIFYIDSKEVWRTKEAISHIEQFACLSEHIGTDWKAKIQDAKLPDHFVVDYVRVYDAAE